MRQAGLLRITTSAAFLVVASLSLGGCQQATVKKSSTEFGLQGSPTHSQQIATQLATKTYRAFIGESTTSFASAVGSLLEAAKLGDSERSKQYWVVAMTNYNQLRGEIQSNSTTNLMFAGRLADQPFFIGRTGLLAVEADLWGPDQSKLIADVTDLAGKATMLEIGLQRTIRTPSRMLVTALRQCSWAINSAIAHPGTESFRHNFTDVLGTINLADAVVRAVSPLGQLVQRADTRRLIARNNTLQALLAGIETSSGVLRSHDESKITDTQWRNLASALGALLEPLSQLSGDLDGYGTGRTYA